MGGEGRTVPPSSQPPENLGCFIVEAVPDIEPTVVANRSLPAQDEGQPRRHYDARQETHEQGTSKATSLNQLRAGLSPISLAPLPVGQGAGITLMSSQCRPAK